MTVPAPRAIDFSGARVLVIGDVMLDRFRYGSVSRISPEAPVPVLHVRREIAMLGGAGNVLANIAALDCRCGLIAAVGDDADGRQCAAMIGALGADPGLLVRVADRRTTLKTRFISASQQLLRCDEEDTAPLAEAAVDELIERFDAAIGGYNAVALSDYAKGVLDDRLLRHVIGRCRALRIPVIVDPKRRDFGAYAGATVIKPNRAELAAFAGLPCEGAGECHPAARLAIAATGAAVLLTLSDEGMALFREGREPLHLHATATEVFDVSGAGDTALAIFCAGLAARMDMGEAAMLANVGAGAVVRKLGTATLSLAELAASLSEAHGPTGGAVCNWHDAAWQVDQWKREGLRVGFTNGCFDIVHAGHIEILRQARATCDRLVVGLNSDASVSRLKGPSRPVQMEQSRAAVLAAIDAVDMVVVFDEETPLDLIRRLEPTDLIKGADYTEDQVVGADIVKRAGGRVHLIPLVPGLSTTNAVNRIMQGELGHAAMLGGRIDNGGPPPGSRTQ